MEEHFKAKNLQPEKLKSDNSFLQMEIMQRIRKLDSELLELERKKLKLMMSESVLPNSNNEQEEIEI